MHRFFVEGYYYDRTPFETIIMVTHRRDLFAALAKQYGVAAESISLRKIKCHRLTPETNREDLKAMLSDALHTIGCDEEVCCDSLRAELRLYDCFYLSLEELEGVHTVRGYESFGGSEFFREVVGDRPLVAVVRDGLASIEEFVA